jgi:taurine dioxygenase
MSAQLSMRSLPIGVEVELAPGGEHDSGVQAALRQAWLEHGLLLFKNIDTAEQHLEISRCLGELEIHPVPEVRADEDPHFIELGGGKPAPSYVYDGSELRVNRLAWHRDTAFVPDVCKGAMLRLLEVPPEHGETLFADTAFAYDELPSDVKQKLDGLEFKATLRFQTDLSTPPGALWTTVRASTLEENPAYDWSSNSYDQAEVTAKYPSVVYPTVLTHPESGRKCLFIAPPLVDYFIGMDADESDELLRYLTNHMTQPRFVYTHRWSVNDALLWDNFRMLHAALGYKVGARRRGLRTTFASIQLGRYLGEDSVGSRSMLVD